MKKLLFALVVVMPAALTAQDAMGLDGVDMAKILAKAELVQACMATLDQQAMKQVEQRAEELAKEVKRLCLAGNKNEAQAAAVSFGMALARDPSVVTMNKCAEFMAGAMPSKLIASLEKQLAEQHVCD